MYSKFEKLLPLFFLMSAAFLSFLYGVSVGRFELFPYTFLSSSYNQFKRNFERPHQLFPIRHLESGAKSHYPGETGPGLTLLTSYWRELDWKPGIRLIDAKGKVLHEWRTDPAEIWPTSPYSDFKAGTKNVSSNYVHGSYLFENGDVLFNIEYMGLARISACGDIVWRLPYRTHHSIFRDESGDFWVSAMKWIEDTADGKERLARYPGLVPPVVEDFALKVSPDGEILQEISLLSALYKNGYEHLFWKIHRVFTEDVTHTNEIESLSASMADQYPLFDTGDLVVSMKAINSVFVLDPVTMEIKWLSIDLFLDQHDPEFIGDGWIAVFDNNWDGSPTGEYLGGSRIAATKPGTDYVRVLYPTERSKPFYTGAGGKFQILNNGNLLITEARAGRVFETDSLGRIVWEWVQEPYDDELVPEVLEGSRYDITPARVSQWKCNH